MIKVLHFETDSDHHAITAAQIKKLSEEINLQYIDTFSTAESEIREGNVDCILTNDQLDGDQGVQLLKQVRQSNNLTPFIVQSDDKLEPDQSHCKSLICDDEFNLTIEFCRYDLLSYWINRLVSRYNRLLQARNLNKDIFMDSPEKLEKLRKAREKLTNRETQILDLIAEGDSNKEIAVKLGISYRTAVNHVHNLFVKLDINTRAEAIQFAFRMKLIDSQ